MQAADCNERDLTQDVHRARLKWGDCVKLLCAIDTGSAALVILDPPYDIGVHNVGWDSVENYMPWAKQWLSESIRVLRAGGALLLYGSPERSWIARMTIMLEDELDVRLVQHLTWAYTQGSASPPLPRAPPSPSPLIVPASQPRNARSVHLYRWFFLPRRLRRRRAPLSNVAIRRADGAPCLV